MRRDQQLHQHHQEQSGLPPTKSGRGWVRRAAPHFLWLALIAVVIGTQWRIFAGFTSGGGDAEAGDGIAWRTDYEAALAESAETGRPVLADFTADWCPPCRMMKRETWPDARVRAAVEAGYIPLLLDIDEPAAAAVAQRYGVTAIPTLAVLDSDGQVLRGVTGFIDAERMLSLLIPKSSTP